MVGKSQHFCEVRTLTIRNDAKIEIIICSFLSKDNIFDNSHE